MKIIKNLLSKELCNHYLQEIKKKEKIPVWQSSTVSWHEGLKNNINGSCLITSTGEEIKSQIANLIIPHVPDVEYDISTWFNVWQYNSGISSHTDHGYAFAMTIYLNEHWDIDWGGNFLYYDKKIDWNNPEKKHLSDHKNWKVVIPEMGTAVSNDDGTLHLVTPLSPQSPQLRYTVQVWGHKKKNESK